MKLSIFKKMMVGLAAMAGLASVASASDYSTNDPNAEFYCNRDNGLCYYQQKLGYFWSGGYAYHQYYDNGCSSAYSLENEKAICYFDPTWTLNSALYAMELSSFDEKTNILTIKDKQGAATDIQRRITLDVFGQDDMSSFWEKQINEIKYHIDYGHFDVESKIATSNFVASNSFDFSGTGVGKSYTFDITSFLVGAATKARSLQFSRIRVALGEYQYIDPMKNRWADVIQVATAKSVYGRDKVFYRYFFDIDLVPGSVSLYASSVTHNGETTSYTEIKAPHTIDFKRGKDKVNLTASISTKGNTNYWELECLAEGGWRSVSERRAVTTSGNTPYQIVIPIEKSSGVLEKCADVGTSFRVKMYARNTPDTVYTEQTDLNFVYGVSLFPTEHGTQGIVVTQGEDPKNYVEMKYNGYVAFVAEPDDGYEFVCWQDREGKCVYEYNVLQVTQDYEISAKFAKPYEITFVDANGNQVYSSRSKVYEGELPELPALDLKDDNDKYHYYVKTTPKLVPVSADAEYLVEMDSVLNDLSLHFNLNYDIGEDVSIELAEANECLDVEKLSLRVYNDEDYSEGFALFNYRTNEWLAGGDGESGVHLWANKWNRFDAGVTLPKTGDCLNDEYVKSVNYAIQNNEDGKALVNIYINGEYSGRNRLSVSNPYISFNYKFATTTYTVTWIVEGETVETDNDVVYGSKPKYDGETPTKAADSKFTYEFSNWEADVEGWTAESVVKSDVKFTAQFKSTEISSSSKEEEKSSSSEKPSSSSSAKEDKSSSSTKPKSSSSKTDAVVAAAAVPQFSLSVAGRNVQIAGARVGSAYAVLDMQGRVLATGRTASASMEIAVPRAGSYMVRVGSQTKRVNVK